MLPASVRDRCSCVNAAVLAVTGWELLDGEPWLVALAGAHIARRHRRRARARGSRASSRWSCSAIGIVLADVAFASIAERAAARARLGAVGAPVRRAARRAHRTSRTALTSSSTASSAAPDERGAGARRPHPRASAGLLGQIALAAAFQTLACRRPRRGARRPGSPPPDGAARRRRVRASSPGPARGWSATACAPGWTRWRWPRRPPHRPRARGRRADRDVRRRGARAGELARRRDDRYAAWAAVAFAASALRPRARHARPPPDALLDGLDAAARRRRARSAPSAVALALGRAPLGIPDAARPATAAALTVLYLASVEVVTLGGRSTPARRCSACCGRSPASAALIRGLLDRRPRRCAAPRWCCSAVTAAKVFLYDLARSTRCTASASLIGFGLLLLGGVRLPARAAASRVTRLQLAS